MEKTENFSYKSDPFDIETTYYLYKVLRFAFIN